MTRFAAPAIVAVFAFAAVVAGIGGVQSASAADARHAGYTVYSPRADGTVDLIATDTIVVRPASTVGSAVPAYAPAVPGPLSTAGPAPADSAPAPDGLSSTGGSPAGGSPAGGSLAGGSPAGGLGRNGVATPNSLSESLGTVWAVFSSPIAVGASVLAGLVFLVLVAFPAELLTAAIKDRYRFMRLSAPHAGLTRIQSWFAARPVAGGVGIVVAASLILCFADPGFGFDLASLRLFLACLVAALVVSYGSYALTGRILQRRWTLPSSLLLRPFTLILTVVGVAASRALEFSPGFLFGMMLSMSFPPTVSVALRARARLIRTAIILGTALAAWVGYSLMVALGTPSGFGHALLKDTFAALSTEGLTGMVIGMLPFLYLEGEAIWRHSKRIWALAYGTTASVFFLVVAPKPESWEDLGSRYGTWGLVVAVFAAVALAAYVAVRYSERRARRAAGASDAAAPADGAVTPADLVAPTPAPSHRSEHLDDL